MKDKNKLFVDGPKDDPRLRKWRTRFPKGRIDWDSPSDEAKAHRDERRERNRDSFHYDMKRMFENIPPRNGFDVLIWRSIPGHECQRAKRNNGKAFSILSPPKCGIPHDELCDCKTWCSCRVERVIPGYNDDKLQWIEKDEVQKQVINERRGFFSNLKRLIKGSTP